MSDNGKVKILWRQRFFLAFLTASVLAILTFLILLQSSQVWRYFQISTASDTLTLYALSSLNFIALVIFGFILLRSVVKLWLERRSKQLGAQIRTRLLVYFIAVSILPLVAMATFSYLFLNRSLEKWFSALPETVIREARNIQDSAIKSQADDLRNQAKTLVAVLENGVDANQILPQIIEKSGLSYIELDAPNNAILTQAIKDVPGEDKTEAMRTLETARNNPVDGTLSDGRGFDAVSLYLNDGRRLIIVSDKHDNSIISQQITDSPLEFEKLKESQIKVRQLGFSTLGLLTFLLLFAASWTALNLARNIEKPIKSLAEAADEIAKGNLSHRVEVVAQDELALLVSAFNAMTTQLQENRVKLEERRAYIETVLQSLSTGVISLDEQNRVTTINTAARDMLRLDDFSCETCFLSEITSQLDFVTLEKLIAKARRFGTATEQTLMLRENVSHNFHSGELSGLSVALTATALRGNLENRREVVVVIEDLSELLTAQRAAAWQEVAKRMAHEIKNPLTPIQLAAERIAKRFVSKVQNPVSNVQNQDAIFGSNKQDKDLQNQAISLNQKDFGLWTLDFGRTTQVVQESTTTILREVDSLKTMVDEFSQFARLPKATLENGDLNDVIAQTVNLYEDRFDNIVLEKCFDDELPQVLLDAEQLKRVFVNLIDNAIESFTENQIDKLIVIKTRFDEARALIIAEVCDSGRGFAVNSDKLFQPYFSTKGRGTGLGLAIVQRIINEHGGRIRAASNLPNGAKFIIEIPVINA